MKIIQALTMILLLAVIPVSAQWGLAAENGRIRVDTYNTYTSHSNGSVTVWVRWTKKEDGAWKPNGRTLVLIDCSDYSWAWIRGVSSSGKVIQLGGKHMDFTAGEIGYIVSKHMCDDDAGSN